MVDIQPSDDVINSCVIGQVPVLATDNLDVVQVPAIHIQNSEVPIQVNKLDVVTISSNSSVPLTGVMNNQSNIPSSFAGYQIQNQGKE